MKPLLSIIALLLYCGSAGAGEYKSPVRFPTSVGGYNVERLANAIYKAENSKTHPYGIMVKYKHTSPRQACINTIHSKFREWVKLGSVGDFVDYLASRYCPINSDTDNGTCVYWPGNVHKLYQKQQA